MGQYEQGLIGRYSQAKVGHFFWSFFIFCSRQLFIDNEKDVQGDVSSQKIAAGCSYGHPARWQDQQEVAMKARQSMTVPTTTECTSTQRENGNNLGAVQWEKALPVYTDVKQEGENRVNFISPSYVLR